MKAATVKEQIELSSSIHMEEVWYPAFLKLSEWFSYSYGCNLIGSHERCFLSPLEGQMLLSNIIYTCRQQTCSRMIFFPAWYVLFIYARMTEEPFCPSRHELVLFWVLIVLMYPGTSDATTVHKATSFQLKAVLCVQE